MKTKQIKITSEKQLINALNVAGIWVSSGVMEDIQSQLDEGKTYQEIYKDVIIQDEIDKEEC